MVAGIGAAGLLLSACGSSAAPASSSAAKPSASSPASAAAANPSASAAAAASAAVPATWDDMLAAAKKEGTVVVAGPPDPDTRAKLPDLMKQQFGITVEYLGQNSSQIISRMQAERTAGQYTVDLMLAGADSVFNTMLPQNLLDPFKSSLIMPGAADPASWKSGGPWFRDSKGDTVLQLFNTVTNTLVVNAQLIPETISTAEALLDPKYKGKIGSFDPTISGIGLQIASALYSAKGEDFIKKLYIDQKVALTPDYQQIADWVAKGSYPIGIGVAPQYMPTYEKAGVTFSTPELTDAHSAISGGFGVVVIVNKAPHPTAAKVLANFLANKEGMAFYSQTQLQAPMRTDIDATWIPKRQVPQQGIPYYDGYDPQNLGAKRAAIQQIFTKLLK